MPAIFDNLPPHSPSLDSPEFSAGRVMAEFAKTQPWSRRVRHAPSFCKFSDRELCPDSKRTADGHKTALSGHLPDTASDTFLGYSSKKTAISLTTECPDSTFFPEAVRPSVSLRLRGSLPALP
jgi:hypothetical protein